MQDKVQIREPVLLSPRPQEVIESMDLKRVGLMTRARRNKVTEFVALRVEFGKR